MRRLRENQYPLTRARRVRARRARLGGSTLVICGLGALFVLVNYQRSEPGLATRAPLEVSSARAMGPELLSRAVMSSQLMLIPPEIIGEPRLLGLRSALPAAEDEVVEPETFASNLEEAASEQAAVPSRLSPAPELDLRRLTMAEPTVSGPVVLRVASTSLLPVAPLDPLPPATNLIEAARVNETHEQLTAPVSPAAAVKAVETVETFTGKWAGHRSACSPRNKTTPYVPLSLSERGAKAGNASCSFRRVAKNGSSWNIDAQCRNDAESWDTQIRLVLAGSKLTWSSKRGTEIYTRCN